MVMMNQLFDDGHDDLAICIEDDGHGELAICIEDDGHDELAICIEDDGHDELAFCIDIPFPGAFSQWNLRKCRPIQAVR